MQAHALGEFLRSRRERVDPKGAGFEIARRRTPGLRREELAAQAGVTHSWLTKLEQGRAHAVSVAVLASLARALNLDHVERAHLFALAGYRVEPSERGVAAVTAPMRALLDALEPSPAYLLNRRFDIVAWNAAEAQLFPKLGQYTSSPPNLLVLVFTDDELAELMVDLDEERRRLVSQFRLHCADWPDDPDIALLVDALRSTSPAFRTLWDAKDVEPFFTTRRRFAHPTYGVFELDHHRLAVLDQPGMQLVVYTPTALAER